MIDHSGLRDVKIKHVGIRPGERLHETLISESESVSVINRDDHYFVIMPLFSNGDPARNKLPVSAVSHRGYNSEDLTMFKEEIESMLQNGGFLG